MDLHRAHWRWLAGSLVAVSVGFVGVAGALAATQHHFAFWASPMMIVSYLSFLMALTCFTCSLRGVRFPLTRLEPSRETLHPLVARQMALQERDRRRRIMAELRNQYRAEYITKHGDGIPQEVMMGTMRVPPAWMNSRLAAMDEDWRVEEDTW